MRQTDATILAVDYHLPAKAVTSADLAGEFPDWKVEKIRGKTGIETRYVAAEGECASDLAVAAARKLFDSGACRPEDVDYLLLCTQSPDYYLPTTACLLQDRLGLPTRSGALDFNLGCSGFVYGLGLAKGLVETGQASKVLLITAETYSKFINRMDRTARTIFGDAAAATLVGAAGASGASAGGGIGPFAFGTDGRGAANLIVPAGGLRKPRSGATSRAAEDAGGSWRSEDDLYMNGPEIFTFTLQAVPAVVDELLTKSGKSLGEVDLFVFHQANAFMLSHLRDKLGIPGDKFVMAMEGCGNTVSSTIPIALKDAGDRGRLRPGDLIMVAGFGVGYSWGAALLRWAGPPTPPPDTDDPGRPFPSG